MKIEYTFQPEIIEKNIHIKREEKQKANGKLIKFSIK